MRTQVDRARYAISSVHDITTSVTSNSRASQLNFGW